MDFGDYKFQIENIIFKGNLINSKGQLVDRYPPITALLYGFYFKYFGHSVYSIFIFHLFLNLIIFEFSYKIVLNLINKERFIIPTLTPYLLLIIIFNPFVFSFTVRGVNSELIFISLSLISFYFLIRKKGNKNYNFFIYVFCMSLLMLTRIQGLLFCFSTILIFRKNILIYFNFKFFKLITASLIPLILWHVLMLDYNDKMNFLSSGGLNSFRDGFSFNYKKMREPLILPKEVDSFSNEFHRKYYSYTENNYGNSETEFVKNKIMTTPFFMLKVYAYKFLRTFYGVDSQNKVIEKFNIVIISIINLALLFFFFINKHRYREYLLFVLSYLLFLSLVSTQVLSILRYQVVAFPFLFIYFVVSIIDHKLFIVKTE